MTSGTTRRSKALCALLAASLAFSFTPIAGCKSEQPSENRTEEAPAQAEPETKQPTSASEDPGGNADAPTIDYDTSTYLAPEQKWSDFDDGAPVLDIVQSHINANADAQTLTVRLEKPGAFSPNIGAGDIAPTGGIAAWTVESVTRNSDTEIEVDVVRSSADTSATAGTIVAGVGISPEAVTLERDDTSEQDAAMDAQYAEAERAGELSDEVKEGSSESAAEPPAQAPYETSAPFVHPCLLVDVADSEVGADATSYRIVANEFCFPASLSADDFDLVESAADESAAPVVARDADIVRVERINDFEAVVAVSGDATAADAAHGRMSLVLAADRNETGGAVSCPLALPDVWIDAGIDLADNSPARDLEASADPDIVTVDVTLHNAENALEADDLTVRVLDDEGNRHELPDAQVSVDGEGNASLALDTAALGDVVGSETAEGAGEVVDEAVVTVDVESTERAYGGEDDPDEASICVPLAASMLAESDAASVPAAASIDVGGLVKSGAESILSALASQGWGVVRNSLFAGSWLEDVDNRQLLLSLESMQEQIGSLAAQIDAIDSKQTSQYYANIVNEANRIIARIQAQYAIISGPYESALKLTGDAREAALEQVMASNKNTIESMAVNLGELAMFISKADAFSGKGLIDVYDGMAANVYNWKAAAAGERTNYRTSVDNAWSSCSAALIALMGTPSNANAYSGVLANLQSYAKMVDAALEKNKADIDAHTVNADAYTLASTNSPVKPTGQAYFCYTTNEWYTFCTGAMSTAKWDGAFATSKKRGHAYDYDATMPFIAWHNRSAAPSWDSVYLSTPVAQSFVARSSGSRSLHAEIAMFHSGMPKYILTSVSLDLSAEAYPKNNNIWRCDTFAQTSDGVTEFKENMVHFNGYIENRAFSKAKKVADSKTDVADMAVIAKATLKK